MTRHNTDEQAGGFEANPHASVQQYNADAKLDAVQQGGGEQGIDASAASSLGTGGEGPPAPDLQADSFKKELGLLITKQCGFTYNMGQSAAQAAIEAFCAFLEREEMQVSRNISGAEFNRSEDNYTFWKGAKHILQTIQQKVRT